MEKQTIKRVLKYLDKDLFIVILTLIFSIITVAFTIYVPILCGKAFDVIVGTNNVDFQSLKEILFKIIVVVVSTSILQWIMMTLNNLMTYRIARRLRIECFNKLQVLPLKYLDSHQSGETVSIIISDVETFSDGLLLGFTQLFTGIASIIGTIIIMMLINWIIGLVVIIVTPLSLFVAKFIATKTYKMFKEQSLVRSKQTAFINEMVSNLKVVAAYSHEEENVKNFSLINDELEKCSLKAIFYSSLTNPSTRFVNAVVYALVALFGALFVINPVLSLTLTVGELTSFLSYANQYTKPFNEISSVITELQNALACIRRVFDLLDEEEEKIYQNEKVLEEDVAGIVSINNVYFSYVSEQKLIENFNLYVPVGKKVAIVGPTGCGKTTLINLLMRFYDVTKGEIKLDEYNINEVTRKSLRKNYGMVLQDTWIKTASVKENISFGNKKATDAEIVLAAKKAHAHNFIMRLPEGYDTIISEDGGNISKGQKQLLTIARAFLSNSPVLILDEATSNVDTSTEKRVQEAMTALMKGRTAIVIAHRLSTIENADEVLVMSNGSIMERGTHSSLLEKKGAYYKLYRSQFS